MLTIEESPSRNPLAGLRGLALGNLTESVQQYPVIGMAMMFAPIVGTAAAVLLGGPGWKRRTAWGVGTYAAFFGVNLLLGLKMASEARSQ